MSRDPIGERGFELPAELKKQEARRALQAMVALLSSMPRKEASFVIRFKAVILALMTESGVLNSYRNPYNFVSNDPVDSTDLLGLDTNDPPVSEDKKCCDEKAKKESLKASISKLAGEAAKLGGTKADGINALIKIANAADTVKTKCADMEILVKALQEFTLSLDLAGCLVFCNTMYQGLAPDATVAGLGVVACNIACGNAFN